MSLLRSLMQPYNRPQFPFTFLPAHPSKEPCPPIASTRWLALNYEREALSNSGDNQLQQPIESQQQPTRTITHDPNHTTYLQAISVVAASKSSTVYVSVQGKSAADNLRNFKSTQTLFPT
uniref:Uncharacterized protein n=1 Tax=Oryza barthii TaxID=65489 RepID=A0A0D3F7M4_9ORYZ